MEWNEELEKKLKRRGEIWNAEKLASRLIFDGRRALEHYTADEMRAKFEPIAKQYRKSGRMWLAYDALIMYCKEQGYKWEWYPPSPLGEYWFVLPKEDLFLEVQLWLKKEEALKNRLSMQLPSCCVHLHAGITSALKAAMIRSTQTVKT